jgi:hypothetical protein
LQQQKKSGWVGSSENLCKMVGSSENLCKTGELESGIARIFLVYRFGGQTM